MGCLQAGCGFSFPMSFCDPLTFGDASCLISCHLRFVSNSCHFCSRCIWGPFGMLGLSVCTPSRKDGIASRHSDRSGRCTSAEDDRRTAPLRTNVPESGCPRTGSASNSWIIASDPGVTARNGSGLGAVIFSSLQRSGTIDLAGVAVLVDLVGECELG